MTNAVIAAVCADGLLKRLGPSENLIKDKQRNQEA